MRITLTVISGPHQGKEFMFAQHDTFLVGRSRHAHFQLPRKDKYFSRVHFMVEVNPPQCRLVDLGSHNGTFVNGAKILTADLYDGDKIRAGHTVLLLKVNEQSAAQATAPDPAVAAAAVETTAIPGYRLERLLGEGTLGKTYAARTERDGKSVALKLVMPTAPTVDKMQNLLVRAKILTRQRVDGIAPLLDAGAVGNTLFFVSERANGEDLGTAVHLRGPASLARALAWMRQPLLALERAHARALVHGDVKPGNLVLSAADSDTVIVSDFALAQIYQAAQLSGLSVTRGRPDALAFVPPERIFQYGQYTPAQDQYGAAAVLYFLLTGKYVFDFPEQAHLGLSMLLEQKPVPLRTRRADVPEKLAQVIHKALARNPGKRFANLRAFRHALARAAKDAATDANTKEPEFETRNDKSSHEA